MNPSCELNEYPRFPVGVGISCVMDPDVVWVPNLGIANIADGAFTASHWRIHNVNHYRQVLNFFSGTLC